MQVHRLTTYPVKSMAGTDSDHAQVTAQGLEGDRRWAVLDPAGNRVSARELRALLSITPTVTPTGLTLTAGDGDPIEVLTPADDAPRTPTRMSRLDELTLAGPAAHEWLSERFDRPLRLAYLADLGAREIGAGHGGLPGETMTLSDAGPILLVTLASIRRLNDWIAEDHGERWLDEANAVRRFRPNVVVQHTGSGLAPFAEDDWERVRIGEVTYRRGELCDRCAMTLIDPDTLATTKEPLRTLARHRLADGVTWFGVRLIPELVGAASISVGDAVVVA